MKLNGKSKTMTTRRVDHVATVVDAAHKRYGYTLLSRHEVITLLRRELANERARMRKIIKHKQGLVSNLPRTQAQTGYLLACRDILTALKDAVKA